MRIPPLRLLDDEKARDATVATLRRLSEERVELRGFEWPLVRSVLEARYMRLSDTAFLFGLTIVPMLRWAVRGHVMGRRGWLAPVYTGLLLREFSIADTSRHCHYADFMFLATGTDSRVGAIAREELRALGCDVENPFPVLSGRSSARRLPSKSDAGNKSSSSSKSSFSKKSGGAATSDAAPPATTRLSRAFGMVFPALSSMDLADRPATIPPSLGVVAIASRFFLLHSICDVFGGSAFMERYPKGAFLDGNDNEAKTTTGSSSSSPLASSSSYPDPPLLRDAAHDEMRACRRVEKMRSQCPTAVVAAASAATSGNGRGKRLPSTTTTSFPSQQQQKPAAKHDDKNSQCADRLVLNISTRWFTWTPIELVSCDHGQEVAHSMRLSLPHRSRDPLAEALRSDTVRGWLDAHPHPALAALWWPLFLRTLPTDGPAASS